MNLTAWLHWRNFVGGGLLAILVACVIVNGYQEFQRRQREALIAAKTAELETLRDLLKEDDRTYLTGIEFAKRWRHEDRQVQAMMEDCTSRADFIVRSGSRIAWQRLTPEVAQTQRIALYLPTGVHRLCYAVRSQQNDKRQRAAGNWNRADFAKSHPRLLDDAQKWDLGPTAETYEICLEATEAGTRLSVLGPNDQTLYQATIDDAATTSLRVTTPQIRIAYPSEMQLADGQTLMSLKHGERITPATDLAAASDGSSRQASVRIWIESEALPCLPVMDVVSRISADRRYTFSSQTSYYSPAAIRQYFLPYDGGECLRISSGFFHR